MSTMANQTCINCEYPVHLVTAWVDVPYLIHGDWPGLRPRTNPCTRPTPRPTDIKEKS